MDLPPPSHFENISEIYDQFKSGFSGSYDQLITLIQYLEYIDEYEELFEEKDLKNTLLSIIDLANSGSYILPEKEALAMQYDIALFQSNVFDIYPCAYTYRDSPIHLLVNGDKNYYYLQCSLWNEIKKAAKSITNFVKKHKKAIIAGAVVATAAAVVIYRITHKKGSNEDSLFDEPEISLSLDESAKQDTVRIQIETEQDSFSITTTPKTFEQLLVFQKSKQVTKELTGTLCHEIVEEISTLGDSFIQAGNEIKSVVKLLFPEEFIKDLQIENSADKASSWKEIIASYHDQIDRWFDLESVRRATGTYPIFKDQYHIGEIPVPTKALGNLKKAIESAKQLEKTTTLIKAETGLSQKAFHASVEKFKRAETYLKPRKGKWLKDLSARKFIKRAGLTPPPKPNSVPQNFLVKLTDGTGGIEYVNPTNHQHRVRVMPGKPHSKNPWQRKPYVKWQKHGQSLDKYGNVVTKSSEAAHIPINEFNYFE